MKDEYEQLCAVIRSRIMLSKPAPLMRAVPPPIPNEKRITQADIDREVEKRKQS